MAKAFPAILICVALLVGCASRPSLPEAQCHPRLRYYYPVPRANPPRVIEADLCVYGETPGGLTAAIQTGRMGRKAVVLAFNDHVGGMTTGGLSATDVGNVKGIGGLAREFYDRMGILRGFAPSLAEKTFRDMLREANVAVYYEHRLASVAKEGNRIVEIACENGNRFRARIFIDATYEGDLLARAGISYHVGRESNSVYNETINGVQFNRTHNFDYPVDPYVIPGKPESGLVWGIHDGDPGRVGEGDRKVQAYNFRMFVAAAPNAVAWPRPRDYDPGKYVLLARYLPQKPGLGWKWGYPDGPVELHPGDCNNAGAFSTDNIGRNWDWPEADYLTRERIFQDHVNYQQGLMYFMAHDPSVPEPIRKKVRGFGLDPKEFAATGHWPHQLYVREGRRMIGEYVMTEHHCRSNVVAEDGIGLASYNMDSHNCQRVVVNGLARNEGDVQVPCPRPYPVSYRSIVPREAECSNLLVPVCLSCSHIAYGSIRMEPVFMILGQSAGTAAVLAMEQDIPVQRVDYAALKERLLANGQIVEWK